MKKRWISAGVVLGALLLATGCGANPANQSSTQNTSTEGSALNSTTSSGNGAGSASGNSTGNDSGSSSKTPASAGANMSWSAPPPMTINKNKQYSAVFHTNYGDFTMKLFAKSSPQTVNNFVFLAQHKFYNGDTFFRIVKSFMIQTGDPKNTGMGGPGYTIPDELPPKVPYTKGVVAMANTGQPNSGGSQFFICTVDDSKALAPSYTELGQVVSGMSVVEKIASIPVVANPLMNGEMSKPTKTATIESIVIQVK